MSCRLNLVLVDIRCENLLNQWTFVHSGPLVSCELFNDLGPTSAFPCFPVRLFSAQRKWTMLLEQTAKLTIHRNSDWICSGAWTLQRFGHFHCISKNALPRCLSCKCPRPERTLNQQRERQDSWQLPCIEQAPEDTHAVEEFPFRMLAAARPACHCQELLVAMMVAFPQSCGLHISISCFDSVENPCDFLGVKFWRILRISNAARAEP